MRTIVVAGGTQGIGQAICRAFQDLGEKVIALYHNNEEKARIFSLESNIPTIKTDATDFVQCSATLEYIHDVYGPTDVLVNCVNKFHTAPFSQLTSKQWQQSLNTHLTATFCLCKSVYHTMCKRGKGSILLMGSLKGMQGDSQCIHYATAKAGLMGFLKSLAQDMATYGVTVNMLVLDAIRTCMVESLPPHLLEQSMLNIPLRRLGTAEEVAALAVFLASSQAKFITGQAIHLNGGQW